MHDWKVASEEEQVYRCTRCSLYRGLASKKKVWASHGTKYVYCSAYGVGKNAGRYVFDAGYTYTKHDKCLV